MDLPGGLPDETVTFTAWAWGARLVVRYTMQLHLASFSPRDPSEAVSVRKGYQTLNKLREKR